MKSLLIGNGAREHAIAEQMAQNSDLYAFMGANNPGIAELAEETKIGKVNDGKEVLKYALHVDPDYIFFGPEKPLAEGVSDILLKNELPVVAPTSTAARLEADKAFCRSLMEEYVPTGHPEFAVCNTKSDIKNALKKFNTEVVVKPAGLTGGKGVKVQGIHLKDLLEVREYANEVIDEKIGGSGTVVIEEKLEGEEFTLQVFTDGKNVVKMPLVQDHKLLLEGDKGPMTGGMGSYSDSNHSLPFVNEKDVEDALSIMKQTIDGLKKKTDLIYRGVLYGQFMLTKNGPKIIEYNVRFGDPEAMNVLPLLKTDFSSICMSILEGNLQKADFEKKATVCKYLVPKGYPDKSKIGGPTKIPVDEKAVKEAGGKLFYASVDKREDGIYTSTSRSLGVVGIADHLGEAERIAESSVQNIKTDDLYYRRDVGTRDLIQERIDHMQKLR
ncbi:MAG: phosphoribosylamine--glycine ligase [Candidatus Undinarchaeales archaeon]